VPAEKALAHRTSA